VLLVVVSMLNAAAIVVFVNKAAPLQPQLNTLSAQLQSTQLQAAANLAARQKAEDNYNAEVQQHQKDNSNNQAAIGAVQSQLNESRVTIARIQADNTNLQAAVNTANTDVQLATATSDKLQQQATDLRTTNDKLAKENEEYGRRNAELTSTLDSLQARQEETQEKLAQNKEDQEKLAAFMTQRGYDPQGIINAVGPAAVAAPSIEGVVREKSVINGNTFVTISVGSADGVAKGMKFYVVNGSDFLGIVTIDTVDSDNSIGKLEGSPDKIDQVKEGNEVKTQLRS
jgi:cell shape-determining protein MreC